MCFLAVMNGTSIRESHLTAQQTNLTNAHKLAHLIWRNAQTLLTPHQYLTIPQVSVSLFPTRIFELFLTIVLVYLIPFILDLWHFGVRQCRGFIAFRLNEENRVQSSMSSPSHTAQSWRARDGAKIFWCESSVLGIEPLIFGQGWENSLRRLTQKGLLTSFLVFWISNSQFTRNGWQMPPKYLNHLQCLMILRKAIP